MKAAAVALLVAPLVVGHAQLQPELRVDAVGVRSVSWHAGAGVTWPVGNYVRSTLAGACAMAGSAEGDCRGDAYARITLDPFRRQRIGFSFGGGLTYGPRANVLAIAELEGPVWMGVAVALQAGLGGGYRLGLVARKAVQGRR